MSKPTTPKPIPPPVRPENIPAEMKARNQWVGWRYVWKAPKNQRPGKWDKPLIDVLTGRNASSTDSDTWTTFETAIAAYRDRKNNLDGIGYVFSGDDDDFVGVDLDHCRDFKSEEILTWTADQRACKHWAKDAPDPQQIIDSLPTYAEVSPSLTGVKLYVKATIAKAIKHGSVEMYSCGRYFTVTGFKLESSPTTITDCSDALATIYGKFDALRKSKQTGRSGAPRSPETASPPEDAVVPTVDQVIAACENAANGDKFRRLFGGDTTGYPSQSEAELALCGIVAFWSAGQGSLIDAVYRRTKLCRDKWDEMHGQQTYGQRTIAVALDRCSKYYDWSQGREKKPGRFSVGDVTLVIKGVRRTPTKLVATLAVQKAGQTVDRLSLSDAASSRKLATKNIVARIDSPTESTASEVDKVLGIILVKAADTKDRKAAGRSIYEILSDHIRPAIGLQYRTGGGKAFSGPLAQELSLSMFVDRFRGNAVIELASRACDAPFDNSGDVNRPRLITLVEQELRVLWSDLLRNLPTLAQAELPANSAPAVAFRQAVILLFAKPASMGISEHPVLRGKTVQLANRTSLASRVRRIQAGEEEVRCQGRWLKIQEGYTAYYREHMGPDGEVVPLLAMRAELAGQIGVALPDVVDQTSLRTLGEKFHAFDPSPPVTVRLTGGGRLVVLTRALTDQILAEPLEDAELGVGDPSDTPSAANCHSPSPPVTGLGSPRNGRPNENTCSDPIDGVTLSPGDAVTALDLSRDDYSANQNDHSDP